MLRVLWARRWRIAPFVVAMTSIAGVASASADTHVLTWGAGNPVPVASVTLPAASQLAAGAGFALALLPDGTVQAWGRNVDGVLGRPSSELTESATPVVIEGLSGVRAVAAGESTAYALLEDGRVLAWGGGSRGQLGDGTETASQPKPVEAGGLDDATAISASKYHALALLADGTVVEWGNTGSVPSKVLPASVAGVSGATQIADGWNDGFAIVEGGGVLGWGSNEDGVLGRGTSGVTSSAPEPVSGLSGVTQIAAGAHTAMALLGDGTPKAWGENTAGELGIGPGHGLVANSPATVEGVTGVRQIALGLNDSYLLLDGGEVLAAGESFEAGAEAQYPDSTVFEPACGLSGASLITANAGLFESHVYTANTTGGPLCAELAQDRPAFGKPGSEVELRGWNLQEVTSVNFGSLSASAFEVQSPTQMKVAAPGPAVEAAIPMSVATPINTSVPGSNGDLLFQYVAAPSIGLCETGPGVTAEDTFSDPNCTESSASGGHLYQPLRAFNLTLASKGATVFAVAGGSVTCSSATAGSIVSTDKAISLTLTLLGCQSASQKCNSEGLASGTISTAALRGVLGFVQSSKRVKPGKPGKPALGIEMAPSEAGADFARFSCGAAETTIRGGAVATVTANALKSKQPIKFLLKHGEQAVSQLVGNAAVKLEASVSGGAYASSPLTMKASLSNAGPELEFNSSAYGS
jgi:hypothetical protein